MLPRVGRAFPGLIGILRSSFGVILIHEPFPVLDRWSATRNVAKTVRENAGFASVALPTRGIWGRPSLVKANAMEQILKARIVVH
jgi:hypothetical protein